MNAEQGRTLGTTIYDVATAAGVAASTVSRALSQPGRVSEATRRRVVEVAEQLGYLTPALRRASSSSLKRVVGMVVADIANPFSFAMIQGAQRQLNAAGFSQLLIDSDESGELELDLIRRAKSRVDGFVLASTRLDTPQLLALGAEIPIVTVNRWLDNSSSVIIDSPQGFLGALEHLVSLGHRKVIYVSGPEQSLVSGMRWEALSNGAEKYGVALSRTAPFTPSRQSGAAAADAVINDGATACVAFNDLMAIGMLSRFNERGVRVPDDVSVVGCDGIFGTDFCSPPLTTVVAPLQRAGRSAVSVLLHEIENGPSETPQRLKLPTHLAVRQSTGPTRDH